MPNYRRLFVPGGTYFFTANLASRGDDLLTSEIDALRAAYRTVMSEMPVHTGAIVVLPDHIHAVWTLPDGDCDFPTRWKRIKREFTVIVAQRRPRSLSKRQKGEAGIWQRRYWERLIRNDAEYAAALRYARDNPVKHGLVRRAVDWPYSSVHRDIRAGILPPSGA